MEKLELPMWITGTDRKILEKYVSGVKPKEILNEFGITHPKLAQLQKKHGIPAQLTLRRQGFLPELNIKDADAGYDHRTVDQEKLKAVVERYIKSEGHLAVTNLSKEVGISAFVISNAIRAAGYQVRRGPSPGASVNAPMYKRNLAIIDAVIVQGKTYDEVALAQTPPITRQRVEQIIKRAGHTIGGMRPHIREKMHENAMARRWHHEHEDEIVELLRAGRTFPKDICAKYGVDQGYLSRLRNDFSLPIGNRVNYRPADELERERLAIDAYYNKPEMRSADISLHILKKNNTAAVTQLIKRRGLPRTRAYEKWGENYVPNTGPRSSYSEELKDAVLHDYQHTDMRVDQILKKHGVDYHNLMAWRMARGIPVVRKSVVRPNRKIDHAVTLASLDAEQLKTLDKALCQAFVDDKTRRSVAAELKLNPQVAILRAAALGLPFSDKVKPGPPKGKYDLSPEKLEEVDKLLHDGYAAGKSLHSLAGSSEYTFGRLQRRATKLGLSFNARQRRTEAECRRIDPLIIADYQRGDRVDDILAKFNVHNSYLYAILKKSGISRDRPKGGGGTPGPRQYTKAQFDALIAAYKPGRTSVAEAADKVGVKYGSAYKVIKDAGIYKPTPARRKKRK